MEKIYHTCVDWEINPGPSKDCRICRRGTRRNKVPFYPKPRYCYDTAVDAVDQLEQKEQQ